MTEPTAWKRARYSARRQTDKTAKVWEAVTAIQVAAWEAKEHAAEQRPCLRWRYGPDKLEPFGSFGGMLTSGRARGSRQVNEQPSSHGSRRIRNDALERDPERWGRLS